MFVVATWLDKTAAFGDRLNGIFITLFLSIQNTPIYNAVAVAGNIRLNHTI